MSYVMLSLATLEVIALVWAMRQWFSQKGNLALFLALTILLAIAFDAFTNGIGRFMGHGEALETLIRLRMIWYYLTMPFLEPIAVLLLGYAGVSWERHTGVILVVTVVAVAVGLYQIVAYWDMQLYPSCIADIERYVLKVFPDQACRPEDVGLGDFKLSPVVPVSAMIFLLSSFVLVWKTQLYWVTVLLAVSNVVSAVVVQLPHEGLMTFISYPFDGVLGFLICLASIKLYERRAA